MNAGRRAKRLAVQMKIMWRGNQERRAKGPQPFPTIEKTGRTRKSGTIRTNATNAATMKKVDKGKAAKQAARMKPEAIKETIQDAKIDGPVLDKCFNWLELAPELEIWTSSDGVGSPE